MTQRTVLWLDDAIDRLYLAIAHLCLHSYHVIPTNNIIDALSFTEDNDVDIFLIDYELAGPKAGATGLDVARKLASQQADVALAMVTSHADTVRAELPPDLANMPVFDKTQMVIEGSPLESSSFLDFVRSLEGSPGRSQATVNGTLLSIKRQIKRRTLWYLGLPWTMIKALSDNVIMRVVIFLPIVMNFLMVAVYLNVNPDVLDRLLFTIAGSAVLLIFFVIARTVTPIEIKNHENHSNYYSQNHRHLSDVGFKNEIARTFERANVAVPTDSSWYLLTGHYFLRDFAHPFVRLAVCAGYSLGVLLAYGALIAKVVEVAAAYVGSPKL